MSAVIKVEGFTQGVQRERARYLVGSVVQVCFGGDDYIPGNIFPFARVFRVTESLPFRRCPHCDNETASFEIELEWESEARGDPDTRACEECLMGVVVEGSQYIAFGDETVQEGPVAVEMSYDLKRD